MDLAEFIIRGTFFLTTQSLEYVQRVESSLAFDCATQTSKPVDRLTCRHRMPRSSPRLGVLSVRMLIHLDM